jgi:hypothetical protein
VDSVDELQEDLIKKGKMERPLGGVNRKYRGEALGSEEDSKSSLTMTPKCYRTSCRLGKFQPNQQLVTTLESTYPLSP